MKNDRLDMTISHDGREWVVRNSFMRLSAPTMEELDLDVAREVRERGLVGKNRTLDVFMAYDNSTIPNWIRPFMDHYFNRILEVKPN